MPVPDPRRGEREAPPDRGKVVRAVLTAVLLTVVLVTAVLTLKGGFAALVVLVAAGWLWLRLRRRIARRRR